MAGDLGGGEVDVTAGILQTVVSQGNALGVEGVRLDDVGTSLQVFAVDVTNDERTGQRQHVVAAFQVLLVIGEASSAEVLFAQLVLLYHSAHGAVEQQDSVRGEW